MKIHQYEVFRPSVQFVYMKVLRTSGVLSNQVEGMRNRELNGDNVFRCWIRKNVRRPVQLFVLDPVGRLFSYLKHQVW